MTEQNSNGKFAEHKEKGLYVLKVPPLETFPWLRHGFSTRPGGQSSFPEGSLNLGFTGLDSRAAVEANRAAFFRAIGTDHFSCVRLRQAHSDRVALIDSIEQTHSVIEADAVVTRIPNVLLSVLTADCLPILLIEPRSHMIAAVHAGWRGTARQVSSRAAELIARCAGALASELLAAMGPSIRSCCYEVGTDVLAVFQKAIRGGEQYFSKSSSREKVPDSDRCEPGTFGIRERLYLDLVAANRDQLIEAGLKAEKISVIPKCSACDLEHFFSYRKERGRTGRMMAAIAVIG